MLLRRFALIVHYVFLLGTLFVVSETLSPFSPVLAQGMTLTDYEVNLYREHFTFLYLHSDTTLSACSVQLRNCMNYMDQNPEFLFVWTKASSECSAEYCRCLPRGKINVYTDQCKYRRPDYKNLCGVLETCLPVFNKCVRLFEVNQLPVACQPFVQCTSDTRNVAQDYDACVETRKPVYSDCDVGKTCLVDTNYNVTKWSGDDSGMEDNGSDDENDSYEYRDAGLSFGIITLVSVIGVALLWGCCASLCILCIRLRNYFANNPQALYGNRDPSQSATLTRVERLLLLYEALQRGMVGSLFSSNGRCTTVPTPSHVQFLSREDPISVCDKCNGSSGKRVTYLTIPCLCAVCETCAKQYQAVQHLSSSEEMTSNSHQQVNSVCLSTGTLGTAIHTGNPEAIDPTSQEQRSGDVCVSMYAVGDEGTYSIPHSPTSRCMQGHYQSNSTDGLTSATGDQQGQLVLHSEDAGALGSQDDVTMATENFLCCITCGTPLCYPLVALDKVYEDGIKEENVMASFDSNFGGDEGDPSCKAHVRVCIICLENVVDTLIIPCGHYATCHQCSSRLAENLTTANCPLCRAGFEMLCRITYTRSLCNTPTLKEGCECVAHS